MGIQTANIRIEIYRNWPQDAFQNPEQKRNVCYKIAEVAKEIGLTLDEITIVFVQSNERTLVNMILCLASDYKPESKKAENRDHIKIFGPKGVPHKVENLARKLRETLLVRIECYYPEVY